MHCLWSKCFYCTLYLVTCPTTTSENCRSQIWQLRSQSPAYYFVTKITEFLNFGSSVTEVSVLLDIHSIEMLGPNTAVMLCHIAGKWETWFRDLFFAVSAVAPSCWIRVIDSLLIGGVFKKLCQNLCDMLVWICGLRRRPSNLNCTLRSSHINLVLLGNDSLWMILGFPCHSESWNQALVLNRIVHFLNIVHHIINYPSFCHCNSQSIRVYWVGSYFKTSKTPI